MANRVATLTDQANYATSTNGRLVEGDIILDTPTNTDAFGLTRIYYNNIATRFGACRVGATIWHDVTLMPNMYNFNLNNNGVAWTGKSTLENPMTYRPLNGKLKVTRNATSDTNYAVNFSNFEHLSIDGETEAFPGMKYVKNGFLHGRFGIEISPFGLWDGGSHLLQIGGVGLKSLRVRGYEGYGGFSCIRIQPNDGDQTMDYLMLENLYFHDGQRGEGFYINRTGGTPRPRVKNLNIRNFVVSRRAAEGVQVQNLMAGATRAYIENFICYASATDWKAAFLDFQSGAIQWLVEEGNNTMRRFICEGWGSNALQIAGFNHGSPGTSPAVIKDGLFNDGRNRGAYINPSCQYGVKREFRNLYFLNFNNTAPECGDELYSHVLSSKNGSDELMLHNITKDSTKANLLESSKDYQVVANTLYSNDALPLPSYNLTGFPDRKSEQFEIWAPVYASFLANAGQPIQYNEDDVAINFVQNGDFGFYNCNETHLASEETRPDLDPVKWTRITWDDNGVPSYAVGHNAGHTQKIFPPDDYRLTAGDVWNEKGYGLLSNFQTAGKTNYRWYIADDIFGANMNQLATDNSLEYRKDPKDKGRYVRVQADFYDQAGSSLLNVWITPWTLVS
jgi:hypothetical protein